MATINKVVFQSDSSQLRKDLKGIQSETTGVGDAFGRLKGAIAGVALGAFIKSAVDSASAIQNFANATGIGVSVIAGYSQAMIAVGGSADRARDGISDLTKNIGDAAKGSIELQKAFKLANVGIEDLRNLSEQDILRKTIAGLARIPDSATRTSTAFKILGESVKGIDLSALNRDLDSYISKNTGNASAIAAAADAQTAFSNNIQNLQAAVVNLLEPLSRIASTINVSAAAFESILKIVLSFAAGMFALTTVMGRTNSAFDSIARGVKTLGTVSTSIFGGITKDITGIVGSYSRYAKSVVTATAVTGNFKTVILSTVFGLGRIAVRLAGIVGIAFAVVTAVNDVIRAFTGFDVIDFVISKFKVFGQAVTDLLGITSELDRRNEEYNNSEIQRMKSRSEANQKEVAQQQQKREALDASLKKINELFQSEIKGINEVTAAYANSIRTAQEKFAFDTAQIGLSERQKQINQQLFDAKSAQDSEQIKLSQRLAEQQRLAAAGDEEQKAAALKLIPEIIAAQAKLSTAYQSQTTAISGLVNAQSRSNAASQLKIFSDTRMIDTQNRLQSIMDDTAKITMTETERKYYDIAAAARVSAKAAIDAEAARRGEPLDTAEIAAYYAAAEKGLQKLARAQQTFNSTSRSFASGWKTAFADYVDNATNAASTAQKLFSKFTSGIEDALVDFVKTGKFNWKSFVADMSEQLLRAQIQKTIAGLGQSFGLGDLFGSGGTPGSSANNPMYAALVGAGLAGGGGSPANSVVSSIGSMLGRSSAPANTPGGGIGGGSSIISTIGTVLGSVGSKISSTIGSVVSGVKSTIGSVVSGVSGISSTIGSVFSGIKSIFGGFFANGGTIPRGKFGIVGERGPEMISGPAGITPMGSGSSGSTNVTYNIQAVDAASFQALVARDPTFLFAVTEQGRKSLAGGKR